jgi:16S rRNA (cytosine1402-N4)-methyltransferase
VGQARPATPDAYHQPVMATEVIELFQPLQGGLLVDATFGGGGHSRALLAALPEIEILAVDRDRDSMTQVPADDRLHFVAGNFGDLESLVPGESVSGEPHETRRTRPVRGILFDLGVSSHQLDVTERGFSFHRAGPLDMRMDQASDVTADDVVNTWTVADLANVLRRYGEERFSRRIADAIVAARPIADTGRLAEVVAAAVPAPARRKRHPARRVFQAIRIAVNEELDALRRGLDAALELVEPGGRVVVISYHSLEDRIVKRRFAAGTKGCDCPPDLPVCVCGRVSELRSLTRRVLVPSAAEVEQNPRARSAKLRAVEKVAS